MLRHFFRLLFLICYLFSDKNIILLRFTDRNMSDIMPFKESQRAKAATLYYGGANPSRRKKGGRCQWLHIQSL